MNQRPAADHPVADLLEPSTHISPRPIRPPPGSPADVLFDDFAYGDSADHRLAQRGWTVRSGGGGPGVPDATWSPASVSFPTIGGSGVLQLDSSTDGTGLGTIQAQVFHQRKFLGGTYAARVHFSDTPVFGPDGDQVIQAFFTISPLAYDLDPEYSELDFEYLPNGGWGATGSILHATSWETYRNEPWYAVNTDTEVLGSYAGWHDLAIQVLDGRVKYYVDGQLFADHGQPYYPEVPMSINFNQWFASGGLLSSRAQRAYRMQIDYVYFAKDRVVTPGEILAHVAAFRAAGITHIDTV